MKIVFSQEQTMSNLQVKNIPESLHTRLKSYANRHNRTLSEIVLRALERELARAEFDEHLDQRSQVDLGVSAASLLEAERRQRDEDLSR
jgi:plasmid stability protein